MLSQLICPKVITLRGFNCTYIVTGWVLWRPKRRCVIYGWPPYPFRLLAICKSLLIGMPLLQTDWILCRLFIKLLNANCLATLRSSSDLSRVSESSPNKLNRYGSVILLDWNKSTLANVISKLVWLVLKWIFQSCMYQWSKDNITPNNLPLNYSFSNSIWLWRWKSLSVWYGSHGQKEESRYKRWKKEIKEEMNR